MPVSQKYNKAFSLVEISVVVLIIAILISGISTGIDLYKDFRLSSAKSLTLNSRINRISNLEMWVETTLDKSFSYIKSSTPLEYDFIQKPTDGISIAKWDNVEVSQNINDEVDPIQNNSTRQPTYKESGINNLPALYFDGKTDGTGDFLSFKARFVNANSNFTIFIVEKRTDFAVLSTNPAYSSGYQYILSTNDAGRFAFGITNGLSSFNSSWIRMDPGSFYVIENKLNQSFLYSFVIDENFGKKIYINGKLKLPTIADTTKPFVSSSDFLVKIAYFDRSWTQNFYTGFIGEIIIFSKVLSEKERADVEDYLINKWQLKR